MSYGIGHGDEKSWYSGSVSWSTKCAADPRFNMQGSASGMTDAYAQMDKAIQERAKALNIPDAVLDTMKIEVSANKYYLEGTMRLWYWLVAFVKRLFGKQASPKVEAQLPSPVVPPEQDYSFQAAWVQAMRQEVVTPVKVASQVKRPKRTRPTPPPPVPGKCPTCGRREDKHRHGCKAGQVHARPW